MVCCLEGVESVINVLRFFRLLSIVGQWGLIGRVPTRWWVADSSDLVVAGEKGPFLLDFLSGLSYGKIKRSVVLGVTFFRKWLLEWPLQLFVVRRN